MGGLTLFGQLMIILVVLFLIDIGIVMIMMHVAKRRRQWTGDEHKKNSSIADVDTVAEGLEEEAEDDELVDIEDIEPADTEPEAEVLLKEENDISTYSEIEKMLEESEYLSRRIMKPTVVRVQNVTMEFNVATMQVSGIKEFLILRLKKQTSSRRFKALDQVSFNIQKGDVVGIIGTNGSGKSTMLKIISGALMPTSGSVKVDKRKVQLLTLGTGFDMELTARENIYLNGAIIGYTREYIDRHFDDIIQFAELETFVDEKLKNYSSGMVSRLGFAIATSGKAAEILILDEVLSVGDIYFRDKSMKRIQEMIHGGSTVIMVSHSVNTICKNCTRAIWIEQGKLLADGIPKDVCKQYEEMQRKRKEQEEKSND